MTSFTDKDRAFIIKLAKELETVKTELALIKKHQEKHARKESIQEKTTTFAGEKLIVNKFDVVFSKDLKWSRDEKEFALKSLYEALLGMCEDTGILQLTIDMKIPKNDL